MAELGSLANDLVRLNVDVIVADPAGGGRPADHPGRRRLPDPDRPAAATASRRARDPLSLSGLLPTSAPSLLAQPCRPPFAPPPPPCHRPPPRAPPSSFHPP